MIDIRYAESTTNGRQKILDEVRNVMRLRHYAIHTKRSYGDWIRCFALYHRMQSRDDMFSFIVSCPPACNAMRSIAGRQILNAN